MRFTLRQWILATLALTALGCAVPALAYTVPPTAPSWSQNGSYTVSFQSYSCYYGSPSGCLSYWLEEQVGSGAWTIAAGSSGTSKAYAGKTPGTYSYRLVRFMNIGYYVQDPSPAITVNVAATAPTVDPVVTQLSYRYETRVGDLNADGRSDLFVRRIYGGQTSNGVLEQVVLQQITPGVFASVVPTSAQAAMASAWPISSASVVVSDFNVDGFVDVEVRNVASAVGVPAALNQIVYSPGAVFATNPKGLKPVDQNLTKFVKNSLDYFASPTYFYTSVPYVYFAGTYSYTSCSTEMRGIDNTWFPNCSTRYQPFYGVYADYRVFSQQAMAIWANEELLLKGTIDRGTSIANVDTAAENAVGVQIGGWRMEEELGPTGEYTDADTRRGLEVFWAILGIGTANAQEAKPDRATDQTARVPGTIYVTSRIIAGGFSRHAAIEYTAGWTPWQTISGHDSIDNWAIDGTLISEKNWKPDAPRLTMKSGTVTPPGSTTNDNYWFLLLAADSNYDDNLPYDAVPGVGAGGYNSNGYARGIVQVTGGTPSLTIGASTGFVGGEIFVPPSAFF